MKKRAFLRAACVAVMSSALFMGCAVDVDAPADSNTDQNEDLLTTAYYPGIGEVTSEEFRLLITHPINAFRTKGAADDALAKANEVFPGNQHNTKADAFRHAYWNVLMCRRINCQWARDFATAHESESTAPLETAMDLNNNEVGRNVFNANPGRSEEGYAAILQAYSYKLVRSAAEIDSSSLVYLRP